MKLHDPPEPEWIAGFWGYLFCAGCRRCVEMLFRVTCSRYRCSECCKTELVS